MEKRKKASEYLASFLEVAPLSHALWRTIEALSFSSVELKSPVLDLGCGFGEFAGVVFDKIEMGVDINTEDLKKAIKGKKYNNLKWADARKLPFKARTYNSVVSVSVMEHIDNVEEVIPEVYRVLKKGGLFVFSVPTNKLYQNLLIPSIMTKLGMKGLGEKYFEYHSNAFKHVSLKSSKWWTDRIKKAGFEIIRREGTLSKTALRLHEIFLITAFPSQVSKLMFGRRLLNTVGLRSSLLPLIFTKYTKPDISSDINLFIVAKKK